MQADTLPPASAAKIALLRPLYHDLIQRHNMADWYIDPGRGDGALDMGMLCLGVLSRAPCSGEEIRRRVDDGPFFRPGEADAGSIHPALRKLAEAGLVTCEQPEAPRPEDKVYAITQAGRDALWNAIDRTPGLDRLRSDFMFVMSFAELLPPREADRLIADRIARHRRVLGRLGACDERSLSIGERFVLGLGLAHVRAELDYLEGRRGALARDLADRRGAE